MNRTVLQALARERLRESSALFQAALFPGAFYLTGYAVECALKACIARKTRRFDFPDKDLALASWQHDLQKLVKTAELWPELEKAFKSSPALEVNWAIVKDWKVESRYDLSITRAQAEDLYSACTRRHSGLLPWIRKRW